MVSGSWVLAHSRLAIHDLGVMVIRDALPEKSAARMAKRN